MNHVRSVQRSDPEFFAELNNLIDENEPVIIEPDESILDSDESDDEHAKGNVDIHESHSDLSLSDS